MNCKFNTKLIDESIFKTLEEKYGNKYPEDFKQFIKAYNAGTPEKYHIKIAGVERVIGSILSYNKDEEDVDSAFLAIDVIDDKNMLPFAIDPFGNYFCYFNGKVIFIFHEEEKVIYTEYSMEDFEKSLY